MELFEKKEDCSGCAACVFVCKNHAIKMKVDKKGFAYPKIDIDKCTECLQCKKVCPSSSPAKEESSAVCSAYAVRNKNEAVRNASSSGGVFYGLAKYILKRGGVVYGAVLDEDFNVIHVRGADIRALRAMQGSKYVQSNMEGVYGAVKKDLCEKKMVLFTGCPCQIDGLKHYLGKCGQERLFTCDLICHGVNSQKVWQDYLKYMVKEEKITEIAFRDKAISWRNPVLRIQTNKKKYAESSEYDYFYQAFFSNLILRNSCYTCKYANLKRVGDMTIGDFWGVERVCPELDDDKGVSLVMINSVKGEMAFRNMKNMFYFKEVALESCMQPSLKNPMQRPERYKAFWKDYFCRGGDFHLCAKNI